MRCDILDKGSSGLAPLIVNLDGTHLYEVDGCPDDTEPTAENNDDDGGGIAQAAITFWTIAINVVVEY